MIIIDRKVVIECPGSDCASFASCQLNDLSETCLPNLIQCPRLRFLESYVDLAVFSKSLSCLLCIFLCIFGNLIGLTKQRVGVVHGTQKYQESDECRTRYCKVVIILCGQRIINREDCKSQIRISLSPLIIFKHEIHSKRTCFISFSIKSSIYWVETQERRELCSIDLQDFKLGHVIFIGVFEHQDGYLMINPGILEYCQILRHMNKFSSWTWVCNDLNSISDGERIMCDSVHSSDYHHLLRISLWGYPIENTSMRHKIQP